MAATKGKTDEVLLPQDAEPKPLKKSQVGMVYLAAFLCALSFVVGVVGPVVHLDHERKRWVWNVPLWNAFYSWSGSSPYVTALLFNGGTIGFMLCATALYSHQEALNRQRSKSASKKK
eukprot:jgi/Pico_ML_1/51454/g2482.t1